MWLIKASLKNPYMVATVVFMILVLGLISLASIPVDILPVFKAPAVQVMTYYAGMPTSSVEKTITNRIERWTNQATGCRLVESKSTLGVSIVRLYFRDDVDPNGALTQVNSLALGTLPTLPPNTLPPVVLPFDPTATLPLGILSVTSPELDETKLQDLARIDVRNMLGAVAGVVAPAVFGGKQRTVLVYVDPHQLEARNLSPTDVVTALRRSNFMVTPGVAKFGIHEFQLDSNAMVTQPRELNDIPIRQEPGNSIYLRDIGRAEDTAAIQTGMVRINGHRQVYVPVYRQQGASSLAVVDGVKSDIPRMTEVLKSLGKNVKLDLVMDQSIYVREAISDLIKEGVVGAVLVSIMILLFLGNWRMTVIATLSIPLSVLGSITGLYVTGNTLNAMTLAGLALAIGPLVDDAIVELENNHRNYHLGKSRIRAALDGCAEVMVPVLVATLTTNIVLAPVALMPGMGGFLFRPLALAVTFAMVTSFLLSRTFVPMMCAKFLKDEHRPGLGHGEEAHGEHVPRGWFGRFYQRFDRFLIWLTHRYEVLLNVALRHRARVLTAVGLLFLGSLSLLFFIGQEFFPQLDTGQITIFLRAPSGTNIEETERKVAQFERFLSENIPRHERQMIVSELGLVPDWSAAYTPNSGSQDAVLKVQLTEERTRSAQKYAIYLRHLFQQDQRYRELAADLRVSFDTGGIISAALNYGASSPLDVQIEGGHSEEALKLAHEIAQLIKSVPGTADIHVQQRLDAPQRIIVVDRQKAADVGLSERDVISQVVTAMNSSVSLDRNFWIDTKTGNQYFVGVQYPENTNYKLEDVLNISATGTNQLEPYPIKLSSLVSIRYDTAPVEVNHRSLYRVCNVLVNTERRDLGSVAREVQQKLDTLQVPAGMRVRLRGEYSRMQRAFSNLGLGLVLASLLVYLLLVALFRSFLGPLIIMFTVPLGLIGVLLTLFLTRTTLNVQSSMGVIFLVGIVVSNGVLLIDFANKQRKQGAPVKQAITTAATIRFRPILMTFLATFLDLLPMAISGARGGTANTPLARAVVGGLLTSTCLTLFVVPILYSLLMSNETDDSTALDAEIDGIVA